MMAMTTMMMITMVRTPILILAKILSISEVRATIKGPSFQCSILVEFTATCSACLSYRLLIQGSVSSAATAVGITGMHIRAVRRAKPSNRTRKRASIISPTACSQGHGRPDRGSHS